VSSRGRLPGPCVAAWLVLLTTLGTATALAPLWGQEEGGWTPEPRRPTVGDTVWLARYVSAPPGWRIRAGRLEAGDEVAPLGDPIVLRVVGREGAAGTWEVRYPVALWSPGPHHVDLPPLWRLAPDGRSDSLSGGVASLEVRSVIPDSLTHPQPMAALAPIAEERRRPLFPVAAVLLTTGLGAAALALRRRPSGPARRPHHVPAEREVPDRRWLAAGEPKAVAARAARGLRAALARAEPEARSALSTAECVAVLAGRPLRVPVSQVAEVLEQLDRVAFTATHASDVAALAARARALARDVAR